MSHGAVRGANTGQLSSAGNSFLPTSASSYQHRPLLHNINVFVLYPTNQACLEHNVLLSKGLHSETDFIWWRRCLYPVSSTIWNQCSGRWTICMYRLCTWISWNMRCSCDAYKCRSHLYKLLNASLTNWSQLLHSSCYILFYSYVFEKNIYFLN